LTLAKSKRVFEADVAEGRRREDKTQVVLARQTCPYGDTEPNRWRLQYGGSPDPGLSG
jgi:hypothetical protein